MLNDRFDDSSRREVTGFIAECSENVCEQFSGFRFNKFEGVRGFLTAACLYWRESPSRVLSTRLVDELISRD